MLTIPLVPTPSRVLLVALDNLGDLVFASALVPPLAAAFPSASIDVWCKAYTAPVARLIPGVAQVIAADPPWAVRPGHPRPPWRPFLDTVKTVRHNRYQLAVLSEAPWRAAAAVAATRIPIRIGSERHRNSLFLTAVLPAEDPTKPVVAEQARLLPPLGVAATNPNPRYKLDPSSLGLIRNRLRATIGERFVAIHPFAAVDEKRGPLSEWLEVAAALKRDGATLLWIGTASDLTALSERRANSNEYFIDSLGDGSLETTAAALSLASLFLGHDSGPLHIANAFGVPVVDVFVTGNPVRYGPQGTGPSRVLFYDRPQGMKSNEIVDAVRAISTGVTA